jgi:hypothetical protein
VQVMRGRGDGRDYYTFKLRCGRAWREIVGLPFDAPRETRSATCPRGASVVGVRVHRGFIDWGSVDTYEFQLNCKDREELDEQHASRGGSLEALAELLSMGAEETWQRVTSLVYADSNAGVPAGAAPATPPAIPTSERRRQARAGTRANARGGRRAGIHPRIEELDELLLHPEL